MQGLLVGIKHDGGVDWLLLDASPDCLIRVWEALTDCWLILWRKAWLAEARVNWLKIGMDEFVNEPLHEVNQDWFIEWYID